MREDIISAGRTPDSETVGELLDLIALAATE
jgi:hypothetical protein